MNATLDLQFGHELDGIGAKIFISPPKDHIGADPFLWKLGRAALKDLVPVDHLKQPDAFVAKQAMEIRIWWNDKMVHSVALPLPGFRVHF